jgi:hypothetical protein
MRVRDMTVFVAALLCLLACTGARRAEPGAPEGDSAPQAEEPPREQTGRGGRGAQRPGPVEQRGDTARREDAGRARQGGERGEGAQHGQDAQREQPAQPEPGAYGAERPQGGRDTAAASSAQDTTARGVVRVVGAVPSTAVVLVSAGARLALVGPLAPELAALDGGEVVVTGPVGASPPPLPPRSRAITVRTYTIEAIAGGKPVVGTLIADQAGARVDSIRLVDMPPALQESSGRRVWVVGERVASGALRVTAFGVIGPAARRP